MILGEPFGGQSVRERQSDANRHGRRPVVSALPTLDDPRSIRVVDNSGVMGAPHSDLLLLVQRPLGRRHPTCGPTETTKATGGSRAVGLPRATASRAIHRSLIVECREIGAGGDP